MAEDKNAAWLFDGGKGGNGEWEAHRRFISPEFNAIYRQGVVGPRHLKEADFSRFLKFAREGKPLATQQFEVWFLTDRDEGGDYGDVAMERLAARGHSFDSHTAYGIVRVFADTMDEYYRVRPKREMFIDAWQQSETILHTFQSSVSGFQLGEISLSLATTGNALAWMCSTIARDEFWSHGIAGDRKRDEGARLLTLQELEEFTRVLMSRVEKLSAEEILRLPRLRAVLYTAKESPWNAATLQSIIRKIAGPRVNDARFLQFLEAMSGTVISSNRGVYYTISKKSLENIIGEEDFNRKWSRLLKKRLPENLAIKRDSIKRMMTEDRNW